MRTKHTSPAPRVDHDVDAAAGVYYSLKRLTTYSGIGLRSLRTYLSDAAHPLPHYKVRGKILVKRSDFDAWIAKYRRVAVERVDAFVNELLNAR